MNDQLKSWIMLLLILSPFWPAADGHGAECLDASPTLLAGKDPYAPVAVRDLTAEEQAAVKGLLKSLVGEWQGRAVDIYCRNIKDPADKAVNDYTARADVEVDYYGNFVIRVDLYSQQKRSTRQEVLRLYLAGKKLRVNSASGYGDVELIAVSANSIEFLYRLVLTSDQNKGSSRKEFFVALGWDGHHLVIRQQIYTQGRLSYRQCWQLWPR